jgi:hypothetical protein
MNLRYIIAGKTEGFEYSDAKIFGGVHDVDSIISDLRAEGYKIFIVLTEEQRIDDFIGGDEW